MEGKKLKGVGPISFAEVTGRSERNLVMSSMQGAGSIKRSGDKRGCRLSENQVKTAPKSGP